MLDDNSRCGDEPGWMLGVGAALVGGTLLSYGWQIMCILRRGDVKGISFTAFLLNLVANVLLIVAYTPVFVDIKYCAHEYDFISTTVKMMPAAQTMASTLMTVAVATLIVIYTPVAADYKRRPGLAGTLVSVARFVRDGWRKWSMLLTLAVTIVGLAVTWAVVCIVALFVPIYTVAKIFAIISSAIAIIEWAPQLWMTLRTRDLGALSPFMLAVQALGETASLVYKLSVNLRRLNLFMWLSNLANVTIIVVILIVYIVFPATPPAPPLAASSDVDEDESGL